MIRHLNVKSIRHRIRNAVTSNYCLATAQWRAFPNFVILGANGAGTTSFFINLLKHPQILQATAKKEIHFFDRNFDQGESWYRSHFPFTRTLIKGHLITGEATPEYLFFPQIPELAARILPQNTKFIVLLRNPVSRAYGHYYHQVAKGRETRSFADVIQLELEDLRHGFDYPTAVKARRSAGHLLYGMYALQIRNWLNYFRRENFWIIKSEDYFKDPNKFLVQVAEDFLGLSSWSLPNYTKANQSRSYPPMEAKLYQELMDFFRPYNQALYELLGQDFGWK